MEMRTPTSHEENTELLVQSNSKVPDNKKNWESPATAVTSGFESCYRAQNQLN